MDISEAKTFFGKYSSVNEGSEIECLWNIPEDLPYFEGHFPEMPVLPGVVIIDFSAQLICLGNSNLNEIESIRRVKFMAPICPHHEVKISCLSDSDKKDWQVTWHIAEQKAAQVMMTLS